RDKLALDGIPYDGISFKNQLQHLARGKFRNLREHVGFKLMELLRGRLGAPPGVRELLFGDDWESDPFTYSVYADVLAGRLPEPRLGDILRRVGVDPLVVPEIGAMATRAAGQGGVDHIFINLERRTPPAVFKLFGPRLLPTFNYFQTSLLLAHAGFIDAPDVARVAGALVERAGYTPRRLENSLADLLRRALVSADAAESLARPLRDGGVLPSVPKPRGTRMRRLRAWIGRRRRNIRGAPAAGAMELDYDAILIR